MIVGVKTWTQDVMKTVVMWSLGGGDDHNEDRGEDMDI